MATAAMGSLPVVRSPCIGVCQLDENQLCIACRRSIGEIAQWSELDDDQRRQVLARIEERRPD